MVFVINEVKVYKKDLNLHIVHVNHSVILFDEMVDEGAVIVQIVQLRELELVFMEALQPGLTC